MKIDYLPEPELEFGAGRHVDIRFGLMNYGTLDFDKSPAPKRVRIGLVGTPETAEGVEGWLVKCRNGVPAKKSNQPNLFPKFSGYGEDTNLHADLVFDPQLQKMVSQKDIEQLCRTGKVSHIVEEAVKMFLTELEALSEKGVSDVFVCAVPMVLLEAMRREEEVVTGKEQTEEANTESAEQADVEQANLDFHHLLKARAMKLGKPIQIILPMTYDETKKLRQKRRKERVKQLQDEATRAWNIYTALYYKAGGTPWRIVREASQFTACYVGVSFYKTLDNSRLMTSTAQVFNELGDGIILRGGSAAISKDDRQPHLQQADAFTLLNNALKAYRTEHHTLPARVVLHKTSTFSQGELEGFKEALRANNVNSADFLSIGDSFTRLYRSGKYPPLRGTLLSLNERSHVLYTRGAVDFFATYPGMYVPRPLSFRCEEVERTPKFLAQEILALTKMNWNNTQFDNDEPITVKAARKVGGILRYIEESGLVQSRYSFYM